MTLSYTACAGKNGTTALLTVNFFSHLHYNVIQRGNFGLKLQRSPKLLHFIVMQMRKTNREKSY